MKRASIIIVSLGLLLGACSTRSISNSDYQSGYGGGGNDFYRGELSEVDVIGVPTGVAVADADVTAALKQSTQGPVAPRRGEALLTIQSGALVPDDLMLKELGRHFTVAPFSGIPPGKADDYGWRLRLMAAQGGFRQILCYWGALETRRSGGVTKVVSWVPIVGAFVPDESQNMRIRLKAILLDVETGRWRVYIPEPIEDTAITALITRQGTDQDQVELLKGKGYEALADAVARTAVP